MLSASAGAFIRSGWLTPAMREARFGVIVNMSSVTGKTYSEVVGAHYAAFKAGLIGLTKQAAAELGAFGIRVNAIAAERIETLLILTVSGRVNERQFRQLRWGGLASRKK